MYILIVGGGKVGFYLAKTLAEDGHEVSLVEVRQQRAQRLEDELGSLVIWGDGAKPKVLEEAGCHRADVVVAVTGDDEDNLVIGQLARQVFGVKRTIARINNPRNEHVFAELGVSATVSSTRAITALIEREVLTREVKTLLTFESGDLQLVEVDLTPKAQAVGKAVREISFPEGTLVAVVLRGARAIIPRGDTILRAQDRVIALTTAAQEADLERLLLGPEHGTGRE